MVMIPSARMLRFVKTGNTKVTRKVSVLVFSAFLIVSIILTTYIRPGKEGQALFDDYEDQHLSKLSLVKRDGALIKKASFSVDYHTVPDFRKISHIPDRKQAFYDYLVPAIRYQNQLLSERRKILKGIEIKVTHDLALSNAQADYMKVMRQRYRVADDTDLTQAVAILLRRVDELPESMVLAQAALESAWGMSRFAREANNLFGQWCFTTGCGLVPAKRLAGKTHEVQTFSSVDQAISAYFLNINSHPGYKHTRDAREQMRIAGEPLKGYTLVTGLETYSARGLAYIEELQHMIRSNNLE